MTTFLLDVTVLIALIDPAHVQHDEAHDWFSRTGRKRFATCPITGNGLLWIVGHPKYPNSPGPPSVVAQSLAAIHALAGHEFWADGISIAENAQVTAALLMRHSRVTDSDLLALARAWRPLGQHGHRFAAEAVPGSVKALELV